MVIEDIRLLVDSALNSKSQTHKITKQIFNIADQIKVTKAANKPTPKHSQSAVRTKRPFCADTNHNTAASDGDRAKKKPFQKLIS